MSLGGNSSNMFMALSEITLHLTLWSTSTGIAPIVRPATHMPQNGTVLREIESRKLGNGIFKPRREPKDTNANNAAVGCQSCLPELLFALNAIINSILVQESTFKSITD